MLSGDIIFIHQVVNHVNSKLTNNAVGQSKQMAENSIVNSI